MTGRAVLLAALGASAGCKSSACDASGRQVAMSLHHAEQRVSDPPGDQLMFTWDDATGAEMFEQVGLTVPLPEFGDRRQLIIYQGETRDRYDLPIFTHAAEDDGRLLLSVAKGAVVRSGPSASQAAGPTAWTLTVWTVDSQLNPVICGD